MTSRTPIPYEYFNATEIMPGEGPLLHPEIIREMLVRLLTNMDEMDVEKMADYVLHLIKKNWDLGDQNARPRAGRTAS